MARESYIGVQLLLERSVRVVKGQPGHFFEIFFKLVLIPVG